MRLVDYFSMSWRSIWERRGRTIGSIIGIIIAVLALGAALGIGQGLRCKVMSLMATIFGVNVVYVIPTHGVLTFAQIAQLASIPYVKNVIPICFTYGVAYVGGKKISVQILATTLSGVLRLIGASSLKQMLIQGSPVLAPGTALIGYNIAFTSSGLQVVYPGQKIVIKTMTGRFITLKVTGILAPTYVVGYANPNKAIFVDFNTYFTFIKSVRGYDIALVYVTSLSKIDYVVKLIKKMYPTYEVFNPQTILQSYNTFLTGLELFLTAVAAVGTLIIGLWMFDTMTMSVIQRTREIGVMKAVGFTSRQIFFLILFEAIVISIVGVAIGDVLLGIISRFITLRLGFLQIPIMITPISLLIVSIVPIIANIIAALWPAMRATRITPLQALRTE